MTHITPHVESAMVQSVPFARHWSPKVDSTWWAGTTGGFGTVLSHFQPFLADFGQLLAPGTNGAILSSKVSTDGSRRGVGVPNGTCLMVLVWGPSQSLGAIKTFVLEKLHSGPPVARLPAACLLDPPPPPPLPRLCKPNC